MAANWHITGQTLTTQLSDTGTGFQSVWEVRYVVDSGPAKGTKGHVEIPVDQHNADNVKATIDNAVYHLDAIANL